MARNVGEACRKECENVHGVRHCGQKWISNGRNAVDKPKIKMSLLDKAWQCIEMSQEALRQGDNAASLELALAAAKYLQLIRLLRQEVNPSICKSKSP
jgi:hypothetical protein